MGKKFKPSHSPHTRFHRPFVKTKLQSSSHFSSSSSSLSLSFKHKKPVPSASSATTSSSSSSSSSSSFKSSHSPSLTFSTKPTPISSSSSSSPSSSLPVHVYREAIFKAVASYACVILSGETGSGKTTQVPQFLLDDLKYTSIAITQPRRISAISLAHRVSMERKTKLGDQVGYSVRFDDMTSSLTQLKYMTDGMLLREIQLDPYLTKYQVVIIDEAHERSVRTDVLLGYMKLLLTRRTNESQVPFKLIIMSATLESELFANYFQGAHVLNIPGRLHEIRVFHTNTPVTDYVDATLRTIYDIHRHKPEGDILAFFNGQEDIEAAMVLLKEYASFVMNLMVAPLFANLPLHLQKQVFEPVASGQRKVVLATNLAETAITIPGLKYVIDHGLAKLNYYHPKLGLESLMVMPISKANALQRAGRAGREGPGQVYRLYTESTFQSLAEFQVPELLRADLSQVVLQLTSLPLTNEGMKEEQEQDKDTRSMNPSLTKGTTLTFEFLEPPQQDRWISAYKQLIFLGALTGQGQLTELGKALLKYPVSPHIACILVHSKLSVDLLSMVALLSLQESIFYTPSDMDLQSKLLERRRRFFSPEGDVMTWLNVLNEYERQLHSSSSSSSSVSSFCQQFGLQARHLAFVLKVRDQLSSLSPPFDRHSNPPSPSELVSELLHGFLSQLAFLQPEGHYITCQSHHQVRLHPSSVLAGQKIPVVCFLDLIGNETSKWYIRGISKMDLLRIQTFTNEMKKKNLSSSVS